MGSALSIFKSKEFKIAILALVGIVLHLLLRLLPNFSINQINTPLFIVLALGGAPLVFDLVHKLIRGMFGSDLLAGISIVTGVVLGEYLAAVLVVLMLSGGGALEAYAVKKASGVLEALAKRMPQIAKRRKAGSVEQISLDQIKIDDVILVMPHDICPVDGVVIEGQGKMDEAYLTGEPFEISKTPGSEVISGAINGDSALTIKATKLAIDSRYSRIMGVMRETEHKRVHLRRLGDQLGALYTPLALFIAGLAWYFSDEGVRFLSVLVVATPCPLLIAIPVAIIGSISLAAKRGIIVRDPAVLERIDQCTTIILDKTGTLTYGAPTLTDELYFEGKTEFSQEQILALTASIENYSKHPLAAAIISRAKLNGLKLYQPTEISEHPGQGLSAVVDGHHILITGRSKIAKPLAEKLSATAPPRSGLECIVLIDNQLAALYRFHDDPRPESLSFIKHLGPKHAFRKTMIVSGDREAEVRYLAEKVGIEEIHAGKSPEEKVSIVQEETKRAKTLYLGDGINDAPALTAATVGIAFGHRSDITAEAAGAVIMDASLTKVDEFFHIARRMRRIALESALGGMLLSVGGMGFAAFGYLTPVAGAILQEIIDLLAVLNALRVAIKPDELSDFR